MRHNRRVTSDEIRETFLWYFEARGHRRLPVGLAGPGDLRSVGAAHDRGHAPAQALLRGHRAAAAQPAHQLSEVLPLDRHREHRQHRAPPRLLRDARQLLDRRLLQGGRRRVRARAVDQGFGFPEDKIWITVFGGDDELDLGPDEEAIEAWRAIGVPSERIVLLGREDNFWRSGPTGPCGPCSELYLDRGLEWGGEHDRPGDDTERFLEYWNLVFMQYDQDPVNWLTPLPSKNIDTGLGLNRMALIQQGVPTIFETDQFAPLMTLGRELASRDRRRARAADPRRPLARDDVPHLRRRRAVQRGPRLHPAPVMRRAMQQGHRIGIEPGFLPQFVDVVIDTMGDAYPELRARRQTIAEVGARRGGGLRPDARAGHAAARRPARAQGEVTGEDAFRLHDTTASRSSSRARSPTSAASRSAATPSSPASWTSSARASRGRRRGARRRRGRRRARDRRRADGVHRLRAPRAAHDRHRPARARRADVVKLAESPFYAAGGGQISDSGGIECEDGDCRVTRRGRRARRRRPGRRRRGRSRASCKLGERVVARVDQVARHATAATTPRRTCSTRRCATGSARTSTRPARTWARTSCASTSPTPSA